MSALKLPALNVEAKAELIVNNLPEFAEQFRASLDGLKYELLEDEDFEKAKDDIKALKAAEKTIAAVDEAIVNGSADLKAVREALAGLGGEARQFRLAREKQVKTRDAERKSAAIEDAMALIDHPKRERYREMVEGGAKGKRSVAAMAKGANMVAQSVADNIAASRDVLATFEGEHGTLLIPDRIDLELEPASTVEDKLRARLEKQKDEEEKAKLKAEADALKAAAAAKEEEARLKEEALKKEAEKPEPEPPKEFPPPPKIETIPTTPTTRPAPAPAPAPVETEAEEMARSLEALTAAFAPVKELRAGLKYPANAKRWAEFANALTPAFLKLKSPVE